MFSPSSDSPVAALLLPPPRPEPELEDALGACPAPDAALNIALAVAAAAAATADGAENEAPACEEARCAEGWPAGAFELREGEADAEAEAEAAVEFEDGELLVRMDPRV